MFEIVGSHESLDFSQSSRFRENPMTPVYGHLRWVAVVISASRPEQPLKACCVNGSRLRIAAARAKAASIVALRNQTPPVTLTESSRGKSIGTIWLETSSALKAGTTDTLRTLCDDGSEMHSRMCLGSVDSLHAEIGALSTNISREAIHYPSRLCTKQNLRRNHARGDRINIVVH